MHTTLGRLTELPARTRPLQRLRLHRLVSRQFLGPDSLPEQFPHSDLLARRESIPCVVMGRIDSPYLLPEGLSTHEPYVTRRPNPRSAGILTMRNISMVARKELIQAIGAGYRASPRGDRGAILDEFVAPTGVSPQARYPAAGNRTQGCVSAGAVSSVR